MSGSMSDIVFAAIRSESRQGYGWAPGVGFVLKYAQVLGNVVRAMFCPSELLHLSRNVDREGRTEDLASFAA